MSLWYDLGLVLVSFWFSKAYFGFGNCWRYFVMISRFIEVCLYLLVVIFYRECDYYEDVSMPVLYSVVFEPVNQCHSLVIFVLGSILYLISTGIVEFFESRFLEYLILLHENLSWALVKDQLRWDYRGVVRWIQVRNLHEQIICSSCRGSLHDGIGWLMGIFKRGLFMYHRLRWNLWVIMGCWFFHPW